jgi:hypothetical protein
MKEVKIPPIIGAAIRFRISEPVPLDHRMGIKGRPAGCVPNS